MEKRKLTPEEEQLVESWRYDLEERNLPKPLIDILEFATYISLQNGHIKLNGNEMVMEMLYNVGYDITSFATTFVKKVYRKIGYNIGCAQVHYDLCLPEEYSLVCQVGKGIVKSYQLHYKQDILPNLASFYFHANIASHFLRKDLKGNKNSMFNKFLDTAINALALYKHNYYLYEYNLIATLSQIYTPNTPLLTLSSDGAAAMTGTILPDSPYMPYIHLLVELGTKSKPIKDMDRSYLFNDLENKAWCFYNHFFAIPSMHSVIFFPVAYGYDRNTVDKLITGGKNAIFKHLPGKFMWHETFANSMYTLLRPLPYNGEFTYCSLYVVDYVTRTTTQQLLDIVTERYYTMELQQYLKFFNYFVGREFVDIYKIEIEKTPSNTTAVVKVFSCGEHHKHTTISVNDFLAMADKYIEQYRRDMETTCTMLLLKPVFDMSSYDEFLRLSCRMKFIDNLAVACGYIRSLLGLR